MAEIGFAAESRQRVHRLAGGAGDLGGNGAAVGRARHQHALLDQPGDLAVQPWNRDEVHKIFDGLEFRVLRDRLFETLSADEPVIEEAGALETHRLAEGEVAAWLAAHASGETLTGVFVEGAWGGGTGQANALALARWTPAYLREKAGERR